MLGDCLGVFLVHIGIYLVDMDFINNYKSLNYDKTSLLRVYANVINVFPYIIKNSIKTNMVISFEFIDTIPQNRR